MRVYPKPSTVYRSTMPEFTNANKALMVGYTSYDIAMTRN
jgi:hypothetical protein